MTAVEKILRLCEERRTSIHKLEVTLGFSNGYIKNLKKGTPPPEKLKAVAQFFGVEMESIVSDTDKNEKPATEIGSGLSAEKLALIEMIKTLPDDRAHSLLVLLEAGKTSL